MTPAHLHLLAVDPGGTTGWCLMTVPRQSIYGNHKSQILDWDYGEFAGDEDRQAIDLARLAREIQSLDYKIGPAIVVEDFDLMPTYANTSAQTVLSPVRIAAKLKLLHHLGQLGDSRIVMQPRTMAFQTAPDDRLRKWGYYLPRVGDHIRDATRHAITALRRAKDSPELRAELWAPP